MGKERTSALLAALLCAAQGLSCGGERRPPLPAPSTAAVLSLEGLRRHGEPVWERRGGELRAGVGQPGALYVADDVGVGVWAVESQALREVAHLRTSGPSLDLARCGERLVVAQGEQGAQLLEPNGLGPLRPVRTWQVPGGARRVVGSQGAVALLGEEGWLSVADCELRRGASFKLGGRPRAAAWRGDRLDVAVNALGLVQVSFAGGVARVVATDRQRPWVTAVAAVGSTLWGADLLKRLQPLEPAEGAARAKVAVPLPLTAADLSVLGDRLFVTTSAPPPVSPRSYSISLKLPAPAVRAEAFAAKALVPLGDGRAVALLPSELLLLEVGPAPADEVRVAARAEVPQLRKMRAAGPGELLALGLEGTRTLRLPSLAPAPAQLAGLTDVAPCGAAACALFGDRLCRLSAPGLGMGACERLTKPGVVLAFDDVSASAVVGDGRTALEVLGPGGRATLSTEHERLGAELLAAGGGRVISGNRRSVVLYAHDLTASPGRVTSTFVLQSPPAALVLRGAELAVAEPGFGLQLLGLTPSGELREVGWHPVEGGALSVAASRHHLALAHGERGASVWRWEAGAVPTPLTRAVIPGSAQDVLFVEDELWVLGPGGLARFALGGAP